MPRSPGSRFGPYEIAALIGVGGMGEVYRAADTNLKRDVAIKFLPEFLSSDADRLARFQREAEMLAALNHPNVAHVYGLERSGTTAAIVMELVDGPSLADRIADGPVPLAEALAIGNQIADALEAAHERSIVHRDLKPANVKLRPDGVVKILDFGIAKALQPVRVASGPRETQLANTPSATQLGLILGTAAYMSPEQARGKFVDKRTDVWAFGCVLYEMLTGKPAFEGEDATMTIGRVLERDVDLGALPRDVPPVVRKVLTACLQKDANKRLRDMGDVKLALGGTFETPAEPVALEPRWVRAVKLGAAFAAGAAVIAFVAWRLSPAPEERAVARFSVPASASSVAPLVSISPDGEHVAYRAIAPGGIFVRDLDAFEPRAIPGTDDSPQFPGCFSPDGAWFAFSSGPLGQWLKTVPLSGGAAIPIAENLTQASLCDWGEDGYIYFSSAVGISRVPEAGGALEIIVARTEGDGLVERPQLLPGGQLLYSRLGVNGSTAARVGVLDLVTRQTKVILDGVGAASFVPAEFGSHRGYLVYGLDGNVFAVPFDARTLVAGRARSVASGVLGVGPLSSAVVSASGNLAYLTGPPRVDVGDATLIVMDRDGTEHALPEPAHLYGEITFSPDGKRAVTAMVDPLNASATDLWTYDLDGDRLTRVTFGGANLAAQWTPDGQRLVYLHLASLVDRSTELRSVAADNSSEPITLVEYADWMRGFVQPTSIAPDGRTLLVANDAGDSSDILALDLEGGPAQPGARPVPRGFVTTGSREGFAAFSPDGRYVAYSSEESGRSEVYVEPFPGPGGKSLVSRGGGGYPRWNRNGRELLYLNDDKLMSVEVDTTTQFRASAPRTLFTVPKLVRYRGTPYDVSPDGSRFLMLKAGLSDPTRQTELRIVINWIDELERGFLAAPR